MRFPISRRRDKPPRVLAPALPRVRPAARVLRLLSRRLALHENAAMPVLFGSVAAGAVFWLPFVAWSAVSPGNPADRGASTSPESPLRQHLLLFVKAAIVGSSWLCGYFGLKSLPLSVATPIRATGPVLDNRAGGAGVSRSPPPRAMAGRRGDSRIIFRLHLRRTPGRHPFPSRHAGFFS